MAKLISSVRTPQENNLLLCQIEAADTAIDAQVYQLYELTEGT